VLVLVVEDDGLLAMDMQTMLSEAGHRTLGPVASATEAVDLVKNTSPDLALVDIGLRDGQVGAALARYLLWRWNVHSIFITGNTQRATSHQDAALGLLRKPFTRSDLLKSIALAKAMMAGTVPTLNVPAGFRPFPCRDSDVQTS
jgi:two-component SAPR family response regulator